MHDGSAYEVYYEVLTGQRKAGKGLIASQTSILKDPKKMAQLGFEEGIGFVPFAGVGWVAIKTITKDDTSPVRAAAAKVLAKDPDPTATKTLADAAGDKNWLPGLENREPWGTRRLRRWSRTVRRSFGLRGLAVLDRAVVACARSGLRLKWLSSELELRLEP